MKMKVRALAVSVGVLTVAAAPVLAVPDANGQLSTTPAPDLSADSAMTARLNYNVGYEQFEKARAADKQSPGSKAALDGFRESRERFEVVVKADPRAREGWNLIGYTSRKLGEYDRSLAAYEKALAIEPAYAEAIEYRAEAYLALRRLDDVKAAYQELDVLSPPHADMLMESMRSWVATHRKKPDGVSAAELDAFAAWVEAKAAVPRKTTALRLDAAAARWN
jgi:tetratricopeptide (TPR) repeat protein